MKSQRREKQIVYLAQNRTLHKARAQLGMELDDLRALAGQINLGIQSLSKLSLSQRHALIADLISKGAEVDNPEITRFDLEEEARDLGKLKRFSAGPTEKEQQLL